METASVAGGRTIKSSVTMNLRKALCAADDMIGVFKWGNGVGTDDRSKSRLDAIQAYAQTLIHANTHTISLSVTFSDTEYRRNAINTKLCDVTVPERNTDVPW